MTTLAVLTQNTLNLLYGLERIERPAEDVLDAAIAAAGTLTCTPTTIDMWKRDDYCEFPVDDEVIRFAANSAGSTAIRRAQLGTAAAAKADLDVMVRNPPFYRFQIKQYIREVIRTDLWPKVWSWHLDSIAAPSDVDFMYDLDANIDSVALVYQENLDADERWRPLPRGWWDVERQINSTVAAQGGMLVLHKLYDYDEPVYLTCKRRPHVDDLSNLADPIADMIPWGAAAKALAARSGQIKNAAARSARDQEGGLMRDYRGLKSEFLQMRTEYARELRLEVREDRVWRGAQRRNWRTW